MKTIKNRKADEWYVNTTHQGLLTELMGNINNLKSRENDRGLLLHLAEDWPTWNTRNFHTAGTTANIVELQSFVSKFCAPLSPSPSKNLLFSEIRANTP